MKLDNDLKKLEDPLSIVEDFLKDFKPSLFLLDPVMGDNGKTYSAITPEHRIHLKKLLAYADILTPNITEACFLTDTPYKDTGWTDDELQLLCQKLSRLCPGRIVITGLYRDNAFVNCIWQNGRFSTQATPAASRSSHGTGDLFASILVADALHQVDFATSVKKASDFVALCLKGRAEMGRPTVEGIPFEKYLSYLIYPSNI